MRILATALVATLPYGLPGSAEVIRSSGPSMKIPIGFGVIVNKDSSLNRELVIVNDPTLPISLTKISPNVGYSDRNWTFKIDYNMTIAENVSAIEVRFIPFDIWGNQDRPLSTTEIKDFSAGPVALSASWRILSDSDATQHYAMLGYVAQVKLSSGAILRADGEAVVEAARLFSSEFTSGDLIAADK